MNDLLVVLPDSIDKRLLDDSARMAGCTAPMFPSLGDRGSCTTVKRAVEPGDATVWIRRGGFWLHHPPVTQLPRPTLRKVHGPPPLLARRPRSCTFYQYRLRSLGP